MTERDDDDRLEQRLLGWASEQVRVAPEVTAPAAGLLRRAGQRTRVWTVSAVAVVAVGIVVVIGLLVAGSGSSGSGSSGNGSSGSRHEALPGPVSTAGSAPADPSPTDPSPTNPSATDPSRSTRPRQSPTVAVPSPVPPPFGTCGGVRSVADARYITSGGRAVAVVSATVSGAGARLPYGGGIERALAVSHVRLRAGHLPGGGLDAVDYTPLRSGRYLFVLGGGYGEYYPAFGQYGVFAISGTHAYRTCYPFGRPARSVRSGITTVRGLTRLFAGALR